MVGLKKLHHGKTIFWHFWYLDGGLSMKSCELCVFFYICSLFHIFFFVAISPKAGIFVFVFIFGCCSISNQNIYPSTPGEKK